MGAGGHALHRMACMQCRQAGRQAGRRAAGDLASTVSGRLDKFRGAHWAAAQVQGRGRKLSGLWRQTGFASSQRFVRWQPAPEPFRPAARRLPQVGVVPSQEFVRAFFG